MSLTANVSDLSTAVATEIKRTRTWVNGNQADLSGLNTVAKSNLVAAINEVHANSGGTGGAVIDDDNVSTETVYSSSRTEAVVDTAIAGLVGAAPDTLDTLQEIATAIEANADGLAELNPVRYVAQTLTGAQQTQARANIGAASAADLAALRTDVGDHNTNFVATFNAGLV